MVAIDNYGARSLYLVVADNHMNMKPELSTAELLREVVRLFVRDQRASAACKDGVSTVQCHVLNELLRHQQMTQQALAERLGMDKGWISRAVEALAAEGMVAKTPNETDKRSAWLKLTASGRTRAVTLNNQLNQHAEHVLSAVPDEQHQVLHACLARLLHVLDAPAPSCERDGAHINQQIQRSS